MTEAAEATQGRSAFRVRLIGVALEALATDIATSPFGPFDIASGAADLLQASGGVPATPDVDAVICALGPDPEAAAAIRPLAAQVAVIAVHAAADPEVLLGLMASGVEDVWVAADLQSATLGCRIRAAIERKRLHRESRQAYATDLATGLPHQQQFTEHVSQLLALREREPAPMAVLVLRIEGYATTQSRLGVQAADTLRRKIAVRLRAAVRASDVVAALNEESFAILLGALLGPADAERVGDKLAQLLREPFSVGGVGIAIAVAVGIGQYPADGTQPDMLLRKAMGMALDEPAQGRVGMANFHETGAAPLSAANDD